MLDTHLHILPGVDDGPRTLEEALALARTLVAQGVFAAVATPHSNDEFPRHDALEIFARVQELQRVLQREDIPLRLYAGHEVLIRPGLVEEVRQGRVATLNGSRYLLLEFWTSTWLPETERVIFELLAAGIVPLIAHPERYEAVQRDPERLAGLLRQGALAQLVAGSLLGMQGRRAQRCAERLLRRGLITCIASDAHDLRRRPPRLIRALERSARLLPAGRLQALTLDCPLALISNQVQPLASVARSVRV